MKNTFLYVILASIIIPVSASCLNKQSDDIVDGEFVGGLKNGHPYYRNVITKWDFLVSNKDDLLKSLQIAKAGQVIYIKDNAVIDLTETHKLTVKSGVTLASGRGKDGSPGALLTTRMHGTAPLFNLNGDNIRITGLRIGGPDTGIYYVDVKNQITVAGFTQKNKFGNDFSKKMDQLPRSTGIVVRGKSNEIDNCEIYGWTFAGLSVNAPAQSIAIHHNYIHHNQHFGLGYGVLFVKTTGLVKANLFDYNNHSVTGTGAVGTGFEVSFNIFKENHARSWAVDMHGGRDRKDNTNIAGTNIIVDNNKFFLYHTRPAIVIRGVPQQSSEILNNIFIYYKSDKYIGKYSSVRKQMGLDVKVDRASRNSIETAIRTEGNFVFKGNHVEER